MDETEGIRRAMTTDINSLEGSRAQLEKLHGKVWDTGELSKDFEVRGFAAPFVMVVKKSDNKKGSLMFQHSPRFFFNWEEGSTK
jgi:hypothetical protein